jgi:crinkler effector protein
MILICWVCGDPHSFPIEISPEKIVGELKEAIVAKKPNRFRGIDADLLNLWKKIIPTSDSKRLQLSDLKEEDELDETWRIDDYFEEAPQARRIHIIIKAPGLIGVEVKSKLLSVSI